MSHDPTDRAALARILWDEFADEDEAFHAPDWTPVADRILAALTERPAPQGPREHIIVDEFGLFPPRRVPAGEPPEALARNAALEEAAAIADRHTVTDATGPVPAAWTTAAANIASEIRALAAGSGERQPTTQEKP